VSRIPKEPSGWIKPDGEWVDRIYGLTHMETCGRLGMPTDTNQIFEEYKWARLNYIGKDLVIDCMHLTARQLKTIMDFDFKECRFEIWHVGVADIRKSLLQHMNAQEVVNYVRECGE
jgi:hypothetical protein